MNTQPEGVPEVKKGSKGQYILGEFDRRSNPRVLENVVCKMAAILCQSSGLAISRSRKIWIYCRTDGGCLTNIKMIRSFNSLWLSDTKWWQRSGSTLARVMACCLTAPSHYISQCWQIIRPVTFILGQFHKRCLNHQSLKSVWKLHV